MSLLGCNIIETDFYDNVLWAWSYPTVSEEQKKFVLRKYADLNNEENFGCCKFRNSWSYIFSAQVFESDTLVKVKQCALVIWSSEYNIEKYRVLCRILCKRYCKTGNAAVVLELYLSVATTGACNTDENGTFLTKLFKSRDSKSDNITLIKIINTFGLETILIYTALLLKKRLFVYDHNLSSLMQMVEILPRFLPQRPTCNVYSWVHIVPDEVNELQKHSGFIAGCVDSSIGSRPELFDILVNAAAGEVAVSPASRDVFVMTKTHRDIALFLVQLAEDSHADISGQMAKKTEELLAQLRLLAVTETSDGSKMLSIETLRQRKFPPALENFLFNLAVAEKVMLL